MNNTKNIELIICSSGGCASTYVIDELSKYFLTNSRNNSDQLKHPPTSKTLTNHYQSKVVFLYRTNIFKIIKSLNRRGFIKDHLKNYTDRNVKYFTKTLLFFLIIKQIISFKFSKYETIDILEKILTKKFQKFW